MNPFHYNIRLWPISIETEELLLEGRTKEQMCVDKWQQNKEKLCQQYAESGASTVHPRF